jgi:adenosylcobinamide kinase/adenosylcobinamide-phosphate guanylyltransferase
VLADPGPPVLVDCLTTWLARAMDDTGVWSADEDADVRLAARIDTAVDAWTRSRRAVVAVSNEVGSGIVPETPSGRRFRDELGVLNARVASAADRVWLLTAGLPQRLR